MAGKPTYIIYDVSGSEKPKDYKAPFSNTHAWPRVVHVSWIILDDEMKLVEDYDCIAKIDGLKFTKKIMKYCAIDEDDIDKKSTPIEEIFDHFDKSVSKVKYGVCHNLNFQQSVLGAEYMRLSRSPKHLSIPSVCLMQEGTHFCKIPGIRGGFKWPSLLELYATLFAQRYTPPGNARADVIAATRAFKKLTMIGELEDVFE